MNRRHVLVVLIIAASSGRSDAQTLLRWKLSKGDAFAMTVQQHTESQVAFSGKTATTKIDLDMQLGWNVTSADEEKTVIRQTVEKIKLTIAPPTGSNVEYDSSSPARPMGQAREIADTMKVLVGAEFDLVMNPRGEILDATPVNDSAKALLAGGDMTPDEKKTSADAVQRLIRQSIVVLPETEIAVGDTWTTTAEVSVASRLFKQEMNYQLLKNLEREDKPVFKITATSKLIPPSAAPPPTGKAGGPLTIRSHEQTGTILFSQPLGRVIEAEQSQKLTTERTYRETTITVSLTNNQKIVLTPR